MENPQSLDWCASPYFIRHCLACFDEGVSEVTIAGAQFTDLIIGPGANRIFDIPMATSIKYRNVVIFGRLTLREGPNDSPTLSPTALIADCIISANTIALQNIHIFAQARLTLQSPEALYDFLSTYSPPIDNSGER